MIRRFNIDDTIIINNLDVFKAQLIAQSQYCDDVQDEIRKLNDKILHREKKYQKLKADKTLFIEKIQRLENDNVSLRSQLDIYKMFMTNSCMVPMNNSSLVQMNNSAPMVNNSSIVQMNNHSAPLVNNNSLVQMNNPMVNHNPSSTIKCVEVDTTCKSVRRMDNVLNELRSKMKPIDETNIKN